MATMSNMSLFEKKRKWPIYSKTPSSWFANLSKICQIKTLKKDTNHSYNLLSNTYLKIMIK